MSNYNTLKTADTINTVSIVDGAITTSKLGASVTTLIVAGGGPKVTAITYPGNDLAADPAGGQTITLTGTGFVSGCSVFVGTVQASVVTVVNATSVTFTAPALAAATYTLYLVNPDGGTATIVPGISYSGTPTWSTTAGTLGSIYEYAAISNTVAATGDGSISYSVFSGTLPTGSSLNTSTGVITGTSPASAGATTYTFVIRATDAQLQDSDRSFSITVNTDVVTWSTPAANSTVTLGKDAASSTALLATSAAGKAITYSSTALPTGLSISGATVTGTPTVLGTTATTFTATAADTSRTTTAVINWTVSVASDTYFPYTTLLLSGAAATETFIADASTNNFALTIAGDTKPNNFNPYTPGYYSNYFDGSGDYLDVPHSTNQWIGANIDFTIECWFNVTSNSGERVLIAKGYQGSPVYPEFGIIINGSNILVGLAGSSGGSWLATPTDTVAISSNTWNHVAMVRSGTTITLYRNGVVAATSTGVGAALYNHTAPIRIGQHTSGSNFAGHISNARVVIGTAFYTSAFTPSSIPLTAIANTNLLTCQSNGFVDNSANAFAVTRFGEITINSFTPFVPNTQYAAYGSTYFDGTGDYLTVTTGSSQLNLPGDFTVELWFYETSTAASIPRFASGTTGGFACGINAYDNGGTRKLDWRQVGAAPVTAVTAITTNVWHHAAFVRSGSAFRMFLDGVLDYYNASYTTTFTSTATYIGSANVGDNAYSFNGYISNLRVVKGTAVYATASTTIGATIFTPPTSPLTAIANTSLLTLQTNQPVNNSVFLDSSTNAFAVTRAGNTSAGTFTPYGANWSNYFDGTADGLVMPAGLSTAMGAGFAGNIISFEMWIFPTTFTNGGDGNGIMGAYAAVAANGRWVVSMERSATTTAKLLMAYTISTGSQVNIESTASAITLNQWNHIAITVDATTAASSTIKLFANGVLLNTFTGQNMSTQTAYYRPVYIGDVQSQYVAAMVGYISNFRILKGAFAYTGNYTVPTAPLTAIANTVLLTCQSNSLVDNSANAFTISKYGDTSVQRFSPFSPQTQTAITHSAYFDGNADYLTAPASQGTAWNFTGDFTFECWIYPNPLTGYHTLLGQWGSGDNTLIWKFNGSGRMYFENLNGAAITATSTTIVANQWQHIALTRSSNTILMFVNGVQDATTATRSQIYNSSGPMLVGASGVAEAVNGYISNMRIVKGVAVYTGAFTVPTAPLTATQAAGTNIAAITGSQTSLLTCQSPTFVDNSINAFAITAFGEAKPRTLNPFGFTNTSAAYSAAVYGGSAYFDGTTDYLTTPITASGPLDFGSSNWTVEAWVMYTGASLSAGYRNFLTFCNASGIPYIQFGTKTSTGYVFAEEGTSATVPWTVAGTTLLTSNVWHHIAAVRNSNNIYLYLDGVLQGSVAYSGTHQIFAKVQIGSLTYNTNPIQDWTGYISNVRVVKGVAVYTSNFVPPTAPLTAITNTSLLLNMTTSGIYDSASMSNLETVADAKLVATHTPYAGSYYSNYFDGTGDVFTVSNNSGFNFSSDFIIEAWLYPTAFGQGSCNFMTHWSSGSNVYVFRVLNNARVQFLYTAGATTLTGTSTTVSLNQWSHVAVCRSGSTLRIFVNGIADTTTATYSGTLTGGGPIAVGAHNDTSEGWTGYISNLRVVNTPSAPYTTTFTPSTTPLTSITGTALLTCQSNRFLDNSANAGTITKSGHVAVQSFNPFQRNSAATMYFDGNGDYLTSPSSPNNQFGTGNYTIEAWIYPTNWSSSGSNNILNIGTYITGLMIRGQSSSGIEIYTNNTQRLNLTTGITANTWQHIALVRNGSACVFYVNGSSIGTFTDSSSISPASAILTIGMAAHNASEFYTGYINDLRVTKGVARYTSTFTPPTTAFITK